MYEGMARKHEGTRATSMMAMMGADSGFLKRKMRGWWLNFKEGNTPYVLWKCNYMSQ